MRTHLHADQHRTVADLALLPFTSVIAFLIAGNGDVLPMPASIRINTHLDGLMTRAESDTVMAQLAERYGVALKAGGDYQILEVEVPVNGTTVGLYVYGAHGKA